MDLSGINCWIDLHLHLDGSLSLQSARNLAKMQNISIPASDEELKKLLVCPADCRDLNEYLHCFDFPLQLLQTTDAITAGVRTLISELCEEKIIYAEIRFAPQLHCQKKLNQREVIEAAINGLSENMNLILCCMRGAGNDAQNIETVKLAKEYLGKGVVAVDLAGAEGLFATSEYEALFALAKNLGVPFTIHAGEAAGADSVKLAVQYGASRIGHGVRSFEDADVVNALKKSDIMLEMCPTSNLNTRVVTDLKDYPIRECIHQGIPVCINTDNRTVSDTTIKNEYERVAELFSFTEEDIKKLLLTACEHSFAASDCKVRIKEMIEKE